MYKLIGNVIDDGKSPIMRVDTSNNRYYYRLSEVSLSKKSMALLDLYDSLKSKKVIITPDKPLYRPNNINSFTIDISGTDNITTFLKISDEYFGNANYNPCRFHYCFDRSEPVEKMTGTFYRNAGDRKKIFVDFMITIFTKLNKLIQ